MKLCDIINNVTKKRPCYDISTLAEEFKIYDVEWDENEKIASYYYQVWLCTDTWVGGKVYFFEDIPVCLSWKPGRKSDEEIHWISTELAMKVKEYIYSLRCEEEYSISIIRDQDMEEDMGSGYQVSYASQLINKDVIHKYTKEPLKVIDTYRTDITSQRIKVEYPDERQETIDIDDIEIPYLIDSI